MNKLSSVLLALLLSVAFVACGGDDKKSDSKVTTPTEETKKPEVITPAKKCEPAPGEICPK